MAPEGHRRPLICEIAWEVCQQVGGIYTVLRSKAPQMVDRWGEDYLLLGPYNAQAAAGEFEEVEPTGLFGLAVETMRQRGMRVYFGRWLVSGRPQVVLVDLVDARWRLEDIKYRMWEQHKIAFDHYDPLIDDVLAMSFLVEQFLAALAEVAGPDRPVIAHCHEWMGGAAIPELRRNNVNVSIVFTTHATVLGRYLAMNDPWFYDHVPFVDWQADAKRFNIEPQVLIERAAAHGAHVFTTLSSVTAYECEFLLGRRADMLLPNGLNIQRFEAVHEFQLLHRKYKERIHQFVMGHFFPAYGFDLEKTVYLFNAGRYEYRNKGFDMTIDALAGLNMRMKEMNIDRTVVFFLTSRKPFRQINSEVLQTQAVLAEIRKASEAIEQQVGKRLLLATARNRQVSLDDLVDEALLLRLRRLRLSWRISRLPAIVTHDLPDDSTDDVLNQLRACGLINRPEDPVKVVYHPDFVTSSSPLLGLDYEQFVRGCHLGVFPSYYEPWGYTPAECMALGVPAITSDLAGFGSYVLQNLLDPRRHGLFVVHRRMTSYETALGELTQLLLELVSMDRRGRVALRNMVESYSGYFDWGELIDNYWRAYDEALRRTHELPEAQAPAMRKAG